MAKAAARGAERTVEQGPPEGEQPFFGIYAGYPAYINEYNRLIPFVRQLYGAEAEGLFQPIQLGKQMNPADTIGAMWRTYADLATARLSALAAYLQNKVAAPNRETESVLDLLAANLRPAMFVDPSSERDVQDKLEVIFRARAHNFQREKVSIPYSSKYYVPDFTFDDLDLVVEAKLCKSDTKEKVLIDEINADIVAYQTKYRRAIFVIYDLGFIRDVAAFRSGIESNADVHVLVIKK
ncbi:MAG: hypothetical protein IH959_10570 [Chloroflexi bacterium]|nr:hypothetical protein [Chloroflexota bacterium]